MSHCNLKTLLALLAILLSQPMAAQALETGSPPPGFELPLLGSENTQSLAALRGTVVYVDFWASWCGPCRQSLPLYEEIYRELENQDFEILGINLDEFEEDAFAFLEDQPLSFPVLFDPLGVTAQSWEIRAMPSSFLLDREGKVIHAWAGFTPDHASEIRQAIREALAK